MDAKKLEHFKTLLLAKKKEFEEKLSQLEEKINLSQRESSSDLSSYPTHIADISGDAENRETISRSITLTVEKIAKIHNALKKIDTESYGICEKCDSKISSKRLEAIPYAKLCIQCGNKI